MRDDVQLALTSDLPQLLTAEVGPTQAFSRVQQLRQLSGVELMWVLTYRIGRV
jgi:hypothetical protein